MIYIKLFFFISCLLSLFIKEVKTFEFYKIDVSPKCYIIQYAYFKDELYEICVRWVHNAGNIYIKKSKTLGKSWGKEIEPLRGLSRINIRHIFVFTTKNEISIVYGYITHRKYNSSGTFGCIFSQNGENFTNYWIYIPDSLLGNTFLTSHVTSSFFFYGHEYLLVCGITKGVPYYGGRPLFAICGGSKDKYDWSKLFYVHTKEPFYNRNKDSATLKVHGKFDELGFLYKFSPKEGEFVTKNIVCKNEWKGYRVPTRHDVINCSEKKITYANKVKSFFDFSTLGDSYIIVDKNDNYCYIYIEDYAFIFKHIGSEPHIFCEEPHTLQVNDSKVFLYYKTKNREVYGYLYEPKAKKFFL